MSASESTGFAGGGARDTEYFWLIEMPDTDGSPLYLTMLPGINQTAFRPDAYKAVRWRDGADAKEHAAAFYKRGFGVRAVEHGFVRTLADATKKDQP